MNRLGESVGQLILWDYLRSYNFAAIMKESHTS